MQTLEAAVFECTENGSGIYSIINVETGKRYIGSAVSISRRIAVHRHHLAKRTHHCAHLMRSFAKRHGEGFAVEVVELCEAHLLIEREQYWIDALKPEYNSSPRAGSSLGYRMSEAQKDKVRRAAEARVARDPGSHAEKTRKANEATRQKWRDPEYRKRIMVAIGKSAEKTSKYIEFRGERKSLREWADFLGVNRTTLSYRLENWPIEDALTTKGGGGAASSALLRVKRAGKLIDYKGQKLTLTALCKKLGVARASFNSYRKSNNLEDTIAFFEAGGRKANLAKYPYKGGECTVSEIARMEGMSVQLLWRRLTKQGMSLELAISTRRGNQK